MAALEPRLAPLGERFDARLDTVYRAAVPGYVAIYFDTGWTATVSLLVGTENPPTRSVGVIESWSERNSYAGGIVRAGEYWMASSDSERPDLKFRIHFTPLF